ncbi:hypothetical protein EJB05_20298 [Eragrostis curvula]|uniref:Knottin scorpion toxin-like domain-containing protein n=1 Tax=Eragrostis curvula TaxID=38414 RepID=A0A5J9UYS4_9POAL|nr:hypothetical protein EJB05_20298 [Eragrostis curvula]
MRTYHGALLVIVALVVLASGICTATAASVDEFPPEYACAKILYPGECDRKACHDNCFGHYRGDGLCVRAGCQCRYKCKPPPLDI